MRGTLPVCCLQRHQLVQLRTYLMAYRSYLWQHVLPTPGRNQTLRSIQAMQARLAQEQGQAEIALMLTAEEGSTLKQVFSGLMHLHATAPPCAQRSQTLGELAGLRLLVERSLRQTSAL